MNWILFSFFKPPRCLINFTFICFTIILSFFLLTLWRLALIFLIIILLFWIVGTFNLFWRLFTWSAMSMVYLLEVWGNFMLLAFFILRIFIKAWCFDLLMIYLRTVVETCISYTELVAHIIWLYFIRVLLAACHTLDTSTTESSCVVWFCIGCQLTLNLTKNLQILW